jgi:transcriptional regulator GlxA family with amidase domain
MDRPQFLVSTRRFAPTYRRKRTEEFLIATEPQRPRQKAHALYPPVQQASRTVEMEVRRPQAPHPVLFIRFNGLVKAIRLMEANIEEPLSIAHLARSISMSSRQLQRIFKQCVSMTPACYYLTLRLRRARELLGQTNMPVMQITLACGFRSSSHFCSSYRDLFGLPPIK